MIPTLHNLRPFRFRPAIACVVAGLISCSHVAGAQTETITNAAGVLALSADEAKQAVPVRLRAVVLGEAAPQGRSLVVADDSGGVYVLATNNILAPFHRGDLLNLNGVSDPGQFAPIMKVTSAQKIGRASMPAPRPVTHHQLLSGTLDAQWIEITGVIQQYLPPATGSSMRRMVLSMGGGQVHVRLNDPRDPELKEDAEVKVQALCFYQFNQKRQMLNPVLQVPPGVPVKVIKPAPADPFAATIRSAASLLQFSPEASLGHRIHARGVVTHSQPNSFLWIRDESAGLRLQLRSGELAQLGDMIDVLGFPKFASRTRLLEDAVIRVLGKTNPPMPLILTNLASATDHEDDLISLEAMLNEVEPIVDGLMVTLESGATMFKGVLTLPSGTRLRPDWQPGSRVRVTGICSVTYDDARPIMGVRRPQSFQLLLRSPEDLAILVPPPWWNLKRVTYLLAVVSGGLLLATGVVTWFARRRLREQQQQRAMAEAEFTAILSERNRVAREIHDTLAQGLTATSFQLRLARKHATGGGEPLNQHLEAAQELVRGSLAEARNSIWNMRSQVLETHDLPGALDHILKQMGRGPECKTSLTVTGHARRLAPVTENNLLRIGQEAITNAVRHANAGQVNVQLEFGEKQLRLSVTDDGCGFDSTRPPSSNGGFGLMGMRERAKEMNGEVQIRSASGRGTEITLSIPLSG